MTGDLSKIEREARRFDEQLGLRSRGSQIGIAGISDPSPEPTFMPGREIEGAKKKVRGRRRGRESTILAGRMMTKRASSSLKNILG